MKEYKNGMLNKSRWKTQLTQRERERVSPTLTARGAGEEHSGMVLIKDEKITEK